MAGVLMGATRSGCYEDLVLDVGYARSCRCREASGTSLGEGVDDTVQVNRPVARRDLDRTGVEVGHAFDGLADSVIHVRPS